MRVLIACEFSGIVRDAFAARGHDTWSCDLLPSERNGKHIQDDVLKHLDGWDLMIAHPPCTYLSNAGVRHLHEACTTRLGNRTAVYGHSRWEAMEKAGAFFLALLNASIPRIAVENPIPHKYAKAIIGQYQQRIHPWMFGHPETKATCLWLKNLPPLMATMIETGRYPFCHKQSPSPERWKNRSRTYQGIANAMANQWGSNYGE